MSTRTTAKPPRLSIFQYAVMIFIMTAAGPFGIEDTVRAGGPLLALIGLAIVPFIFSLPQVTPSLSPKKKQNWKQKNSLLCAPSSHR